MKRVPITFILDYQTNIKNANLNLSKPLHHVLLIFRRWIDGFLCMGKCFAKFYRNTIKFAGKRYSNINLITLIPLETPLNPQKIASLKHFIPIYNSNTKREELNP